MKRLKKTVQSKNTTRKKNNGGMTYVELLVALSLLVLIVTMFSPMLLSSYDRIYRAGEITSDAFDSRQDLEKGLSSREDHEILGVEAKFASNTGVLANKIYIMAKRVVSSFDGLETLYVGGKGKIEIVNNEDGLVKDNQSSHIIRLKLTNLAYKDYDVIKDSAVIEQLNKGNVTSLRGKVRFYVCSIFDTATALEGEVIRKPNFKQGNSYFPYCDLRIDNVDITKSPLKIVAYYLNEYGSVKEATTYLTIEKSDVIFVGETSREAQYFTLSDAGSFDAAVPVIAGRKMEESPIPAGKTLTDVTFVNAGAGVDEGYYSMCGEDGIARRLWHLTDANASTVSALDGTAINNDDPSRITFKSQALNGNQVYFQYDWAGDMNDLLALSDEKGRDVIEYVENKKTSLDDVDFEEGDYIWRNEYNLDNNYFSYYVNGYTSGRDTYRDTVRRISYVLTPSKAQVKTEYGIEPLNGMQVITKKHKYQSAASRHNGRSDDGGKRYVYLPNGSDWVNGRWYNFKAEYDWNWEATYSVRSVNEQGAQGLSVGTGFVDQQNGVYLGGNFVYLKKIAKGNEWGDYEKENTYEGESSFDDNNIAYITLKAYNSLNPGALIASGTVEARNNTSEALVDFSSCGVLPGTFESLYLGTVDTSAIINQTEGVTGAADTTNGISDGQGFVTGYIKIGQDGKTYSKTYSQSANVNWSSVIKDVGSLGRDNYPNGEYPRNAYKAEYGNNGENKNTHLSAGTNNPNGWTVDDNLRFTMGYSSDLYKVFSSLNSHDDKPFEDLYKRTNNKTNESAETYGDLQKNLWFPREFLNLTESDTYQTSVVAVGYALGGRSTVHAEKRLEYGIDTSKYKNNLFTDGKDTDKDWEIDPNEIAEDWDYFFNQSFSFGGKTYYYFDTHNSADTATLIRYPIHVVASTVVDYICNDGVISVYNASSDDEAKFTHIGYVKGSETENVRFTSVSVDMLQSTGNGNGVLGAAIGGSNGKLYFAKLTYTGGAIAETALKWGSTLVEITNLSTYYSSIDTVKAFNLNGTFYILVGGKSANNKAYISLVTVNAGNPASSTVKHVKFAEVPYDVTDIILADKYVCFTSHQSDGSGSEGCVVIGELFANGSMKNIDTVGWKFITRYHTEFDSDAKTGAIKAKGDGTPLPRLKALASSVPVSYS